MADFDLSRWFFEESSKEDDEQAQLLLAPVKQIEAPPLPIPELLSFSDYDNCFDGELHFTLPPFGDQLMNDPFIYNNGAQLDGSLSCLSLNTSQSVEAPPSPRLEFESSFCSAAMIPFARYGDDSEMSDSSTSASSSNESDDMPRLYMPSRFEDETSFLFQQFEQEEEMDRFAIRTQRERSKFPSRFIKCPKRPYQCSDCDHSFRRLHDYRRHILTHMAKSNADTDYRWRCQMCDQSFTRFFALKRHHQRKHKTLPFQRTQTPRAPPTPRHLSLTFNHAHYGGPSIH